jgi:hypothetical protein
MGNVEEVYCLEQARKMKVPFTSESRTGQARLPLLLSTTALLVGFAVVVVSWSNGVKDPGLKVTGNSLLSPSLVHRHVAESIDCECLGCRTSVWKNKAGAHSCGDRMHWLATARANQYPSLVEACRRVAFEFPTECGRCDVSSVCSLDNITPGDPEQPDARCATSTCTDTIWNTKAGAHTCGERITWLKTARANAYPTEVDACRRVVFEFPIECGACDPSVPIPMQQPAPTRSPTPRPTKLPTSVPTQRPTPVPTEWPTPVSTEWPTPIPTKRPTLFPTESPTTPPTSPIASLPTEVPTGLLTSIPSKEAADDPDQTIACGCQSCSERAWNTFAGQYTCGARIQWLSTAMARVYPTQADACRRVGFEFPRECRDCDPSQCNTAAEPPAGAPTSNLPHVLYCFPDENDRVSFTMWNNLTVQVKTDRSNGLCGPGNNRFVEENIVVNGDDLSLQFKNGQASEVRILLPNSEVYGYGKYQFSVKSIAVKDASGVVLSDILPKELVLGMFTWDDTEDYATHENYNHEVDVEISRWNEESNADTQFLVQPPGSPQMYRFFSGSSGSYDQGGHKFDFTWNPNRIDWSSTAGGGQSYSLTTQLALDAGTPDYIQCMPSGNVEIRLNLWNSLGPIAPAGLASTDVVEVVFDDVSYTPSGLSFAADDDFCSKDCQCSNASTCVGNRCRAK